MRDGSARYWALLPEMVIAGVMVTWEKLFTAEPAGLMPTEPRSPPRAVKALPIAMVLAVP